MNTTDEKYIEISTDKMYEMIMNNNCFSLNNGDIISNINNGSTYGEEDDDEKYLIEATWVENGIEKDLYITFSDVEKIEFSKNTKAYIVHAKKEEKIISVRIFDENAIEPIV